MNLSFLCFRYDFESFLEAFFAFQNWIFFICRSVSISQVQGFLIIQCRQIFWFRFFEFCIFWVKVWISNFSITNNKFEEFFQLFITFFQFLSIFFLHQDGIKLVSITISVNLCHGIEIEVNWGHISHTKVTVRSHMAVHARYSCECIYNKGQCFISVQINHKILFPIGKMTYKMTFMHICTVVRRYLPEIKGL